MGRILRLATVAGGALAFVHCGESGRYGVTSSGQPANPGNPATPSPAGTASASILLPVKVPGNTPVNVGDSVLVKVRVSSAKRVAQYVLQGVARRGDINLGNDTVVDRYTKRIVPVPFVTDTIMSRYIKAIPG